MSEFRALAASAGTTPPDSGFRRRWSDVPPAGRFAAFGASAPSDGAAAPYSAVPDLDQLLVEARAEGFAAGRAEGVAATRSQMMTDDAARIVLAHALDQLSPLPLPRVAGGLADELLKIIAAIVGEAPVDAALLTERCHEALTLVGAEALEPMLHLNPADVVLVRDLDPDLPVVASADVARGAVRLVYPGGAVAHGTASLLDDLATAWRDDAA